jgi:hypothetical protein
MPRTPPQKPICLLWLINCFYALLRKKHEADEHVAENIPPDSGTVNEIIYLPTNVLWNMDIDIISEN